MNYVVLYIRLDSYARHRAKKHGEEISEEDFDMTTKREVLALTIFTIIILTYPIAITVLLSVNASSFSGNIIHAWERYDTFYMYNFVIVAVLLVITTYVSLSHMRKVFGEKSM